MMLAEPMTATRHPLRETFALLQAANDEFRSHVLYERDEHAGWVAVSALAAEGTTHLQKVFSKVVSRYPTSDKRAPAALWFGHYAFAVEAVAVACYLAAQRVPDMSIKTVDVRFDEDGEMAGFVWHSPRFIALPDDPDAAHIDCRVVDSRDALRTALREQIVGHLTPIIDAVSACSPFGKPGMWALAADYCAHAFTWVAGVMGDEAMGAQEARLLWSCPSRLSLRRDFIFIEQSGLSYHLLDRTSCCLYYKCDNGEYCSSCPHRPREERVQLHRNWLARRAEGAAAE
jgi:ferric iron reductase protein FhuF